MSDESERILVVDDEESIRRLLVRALSQKGYDVSEAVGGREALELLQQKSINIMFIDLNMPEMNGLELCREIRKHNPIACIYAVTGFSAFFEPANCREAGFDDYFIKPLTLEQIWNAAAEACQKLRRWKETHGD